jgi:hypothetical protein
MAPNLKYLDVAERVLAKHRRPLRSRDLISLGIEDGFVESWDSNTPQKSMQARLSMDILRKGPNSRFLRTERGKFYLRNLLGAPLSLNDDLLFSTEDKAHFARPFTTLRRLYPSPLEHVLTIPLEVSKTILNFQGIRRLGPRTVRKLINQHTILYIPRIEAEARNDRKQILTYILVTYRNKVLSFRRGAYNNTAAFLRGSRCIGFGGHGYFDTVIAYGLFHCLSSTAEIIELHEILAAATKDGGHHVVCAFNSRNQDLAGHSDFKPCLASHAFYESQYEQWHIEEISDEDLFETHPHNGIPHVHSLTRMIARKTG